MVSRRLPALLLCFALLSVCRNDAADLCSSAVFSSNKQYSTCNTLQRLGASLHWTYYPSNGTADIAFRAPQSNTGFIGWGLNPTGSGMLNAQVLLAFPGSDGNMALITTAIGNNYAPTIQNESLSFAVTNPSAEYDSLSNVMTIYANVQLPNNSTTVNHVWQAGTVSGGLPSAHTQAGDNILSKGSVDFLSGVATADSRIPRQHRKNAHGVVNAVSWGILMPLGGMVARYMRVFKSADPAWFYIHIGCQVTAYVIGVAGWGTGLKLGSESVGITYHAHRNIGITLFCLATLQVFALLLRPNKDHKYRIYWNVYHHSVGYIVIILSVVNIFKGLDILDPEKKWKHAYIAIIVALAAIAAVLEASTWAIVLKRKSRNSDKSHDGGYGQNQRGIEL